MSDTIAYGELTLEVRPESLLTVAKRRRDVGKLVAAREAFAAGCQRTLPYAPADLFVLVGEPPSPRLDWRWLVRNVALDVAAGE